MKNFINMFWIARQNNLLLWYDTDFKQWVAGDYKLYCSNYENTNNLIGFDNKQKRNIKTFY